MEKSEMGLTRSAAMVWFLLGLFLVVNDSGAGWVFFIIGLSYLARTSEAGDHWARKNPGLARWLIIGLTVMMLMAVGLMFAMKVIQ